jgi:hypothetical protein
MDSSSDRKMDVGRHARRRLQGEHDVIDAVIKERTEFSPGETKGRLGYLDNALQGKLRLPMQPLSKPVQMLDRAFACCI